MTEHTCIEQVVETVRAAAKLPPKRVVEPRSRLVEDLGVDSLDLVGVLLAVQDRFDIVIEDADLEKLTTIDKLASYVYERLERNEPADGCDSARVAVSARV